MKILIVEDDASISHALKMGLEADAHVVDVAENGQDGSFLGRTYEYDAVVLDHALPGKNGLAVCREIRASERQTPIIFLSVEGDVDLKVKALEDGADDYMTKPFSFSELKSRIRAVSRRSHKTIGGELTIHDLILDTKSLSASRDEKMIRLTRKEFSLLEYMMRHQGIVLSRSTIMEHVWTADSDPFSNTIEAHMSNLRRKISIGKKPDLIINIPGQGYMMDTPLNLAKFKR
jgi:two-component system OmpR family response regulator